MIELNPDDLDEPRVIDPPRTVGIHAKIEHAMREEMRRVSDLTSKTASTLRFELTEICTDAHRLSMSAEALVIAMKDVWQGIPESRTFTRPLGVDSILSQSVTIALDEFYRAPVASSRAD